jgi:Na+-driven multidrug efflux pump
LKTFLKHTHLKETVSLSIPLILTQIGHIITGMVDNIFLGKLGIEVGKKNLSFGANYMIPIQQNLTGGNVEANYRWSLNLNYML